MAAPIRKPMAGPNPVAGSWAGCRSPMPREPLAAISVLSHRRASTHASWCRSCRQALDRDSRAGVSTGRLPMRFGKSRGP